MTQQELELPKGWVETNIGSISELIRGVTYKKEKSQKNKADGLIPVLRANNFNETFVLDDLVYLPKDLIKPEQMILKNDIIISMSSGSKHLVGKSAMAKSDMSCAFGTFCGLVRPTKSIYGPILGFFFQSPEYRKKISSISQGININNLRRDFIESLRFPLAPLNEQKRIVTKIEELLSKIDSTKQSLERTKLQLEQYRYSHHNWIFYGDFKEKFGFSSNWEQKPLGETFKIIGGGTPNTKKSQYWNGDIPWITSADIYGIKNIIPRRKVSQLGIDNSATNKIPANSVLVVTRVGLGKLAITDKPICINQDVQAVIIDSKTVLPLFVLNYLSQTIQIFRFRNQGTTISGVTKKQLSDIPFFLPSLDEQARIIEYMEMAEAIIQNSQNIVNSTLQTLETMRMSVLKQAFEGKLVPQDPNDEPAEILLEQIKKQKS